MMNSKCEICGKDTDYFIDSFSVLHGNRKLMLYLCPAHQDMVNDAMLAEIERLKHIRLDYDV